MNQGENGEVRVSFSGFFQTTTVYYVLSYYIYISYKIFIKIAKLWMKSGVL